MLAKQNPQVPSVYAETRDLFLLREINYNQKLIDEVNEMSEKCKTISICKEKTIYNDEKRGMHITER